MAVVRGGGGRRHHLFFCCVCVVPSLPSCVIASVGKLGLTLVFFPSFMISQRRGGNWNIHITHIVVCHTAQSACRNVLASQPAEQWRKQSVNQMNPHHWCMNNVAWLASWWQTSGLQWTNKFCKTATSIVQHASMKQRHFAPSDGWRECQI